MRHALFLAWLLAVPASPVTPAPLPAPAAGPPATPTERGLRGLLAIRGDAVLAAESAERLFAPASVVKLVVAVAALERLGPEHRIRTQLIADGPLVESALSGDLVLRAAGDPTWNERFFPDDPHRPLGLLARRLAARGVRRVHGDLVVDLGRFPGLPQPRSRPLAELAMAWAAPVAALTVDQNAFTVAIAPGPAVGTPASARHVAGGEGAGAGGPTGPPLINAMRTVGRERHEKGTVEFWPLPDRGALLLRGEYPISEPAYRVRVALPAPERHTAELFRTALRAAGIEVAGETRLSSRPVAAAGPVLAHLDSPPLARWLKPILEDSHNWYAEMLLRQLALDATGEARLDDALDQLAAFLTEEVGVAPGSFFLDDGSGLSADNLISPRAVVELLAWARRRPWRRVLIDALASSGEGTLASWGPLPPIAAKTGTRRHVKALAGYLRPESAEPVIFAIFLDHQTAPGGELEREIGALLRRW